ncbi:MAG TPA: OB-fold nucleic acid binding domain-containing protein, partial [Acidimicrobiales bacterium]|nr:OB-fold nucleic acid binding domain-containing protein [Acidimicrobiales bacterium]
AIDVGNFSAGDADQLRQAMGSKRSTERMEALKGRLYEGMAVNGITGQTADAIYDKLAAFANFGFPESHSVSFAYLVYSSSWMKLHYPAAFCAALLNAQPMGFYSPNTLVADARRHGVTVHGPDVNLSDVKATLEGAPDSPEVRLGIEYVRNVGDDLATRIAERRPYASMEDLVRRTGANLPAVEALSTAGAFGSLQMDRRQALWGAGAVAQAADTRLEGVVVGTDAPRLPAMSEPEVTAADLWATGVSPSSHVMQYARAGLDAAGAVTVTGLERVPSGRRVQVGGVVTHRQRPATANGTIFINLEDETGMLNVICNNAIWDRYRRAARSSAALLIRGKLERAEGVTNLIAETIEPLSLSAQTTKSRDFR